MQTLLFFSLYRLTLTNWEHFCPNQWNETGNLARMQLRDRTWKFDVLTMRYERISAAWPWQSGVNYKYRRQPQPTNDRHHRLRTNCVLFSFFRTQRTDFLCVLYLDLSRRKTLLQKMHQSVIPQPISHLWNVNRAANVKTMERCCCAIR